VDQVDLIKILLSALAALGAIVWHNLRAEMARIEAAARTEMNRIETTIRGELARIEMTGKTSAASIDERLSSFDQSRIRPVENSLNAFSLSIRDMSADVSKAIGELKLQLAEQYPRKHELDAVMNLQSRRLEQIEDDLRSLVANLTANSRHTAQASAPPATSRRGRG